MNITRYKRIALYTIARCAYGNEWSMCNNRWFFNMIFAMKCDHFKFQTSVSTSISPKHSASFQHPRSVLNLYSIYSLVEISWKISARVSRSFSDVPIPPLAHTNRPSTTFDRCNRERWRARHFKYDSHNVLLSIFFYFLHNTRTRYSTHTLNVQIRISGCV